MQNCVFEYTQTAKAQTACASTQSDEDLHCLQTESLDTKECFNGEQMAG